MPRKQRLINAYAALVIFRKNLKDGELKGVCTRGLEKIKFQWMAEED